MATVDKKIADQVIAGRFPEDQIVKIVEYDNAFGGQGYGLVHKGEPDRYYESEFVRSPRVYWEKKCTAPRGKIEVPVVIHIICEKKDLIQRLLDALNPNSSVKVHLEAFHE